jgi:alpha-D-xyloside xylohydrolase
LINYFFPAYILVRPLLIYRLVHSSVCIILLTFLSSFSDPHIPGTYTKTKDGVIVFPNPRLSGHAQVVKLQVVSHNIIRVSALPAKDAILSKSLITVYTPDTSVRWTLIPGKESVVVRTKLLSATISLQSGLVSFSDGTGKKILSESTMGREIKPVVYEGQRSYAVKQSFSTSTDDAFYGLGQHQDGQFNYRGNQVLLFQNNTEVAVPFLISNKSYGLLWNNYSITQVGDVRPFRPLSSLMLFSKKGEQGWLTATYANDAGKREDLLMEKAESAINYEFLNDSKRFLPAEFNPSRGIITWEGSMVSHFEGVHKFRFTYGGYLKVWLDGKLVADRWRQSWNPGAALIDLPMQKGKKVPVKIEWIPNGGESYITAKWMEPIAAGEENQFAFQSEAGKGLDYYFIYGKNMDEVISGYRKLTGKATMIPKWALGKWQSRERYKTQKEVLETVAEFRKRRIPLDNIVLDWSYWKEADWGSQDFDTSRFPAPDSMIRVLHDQYKTHFMISVWPKFYEGISAYNEFDEKGWLYKRNISDRQRDWIGKGYVSTFYDAFNEAAQKGFWDLISKKLFSKGVDAWWMDASEPDILSNVTPEKRKEQMAPLAAGIAAEYLNAYPLQNAKGIYEGQRATSPDKRVFILTRSAFAGMQRYAAATWSGDIASRWHDMQAQIPAGVNFSMSGLPYWTMDIGGFAVEYKNENAKGEELEEWRELMNRWYQYGAFVPLFRVHGQFPFREIYHTAPEDHPAYQGMLYYDHLRYRLMPYIYSLAGMCYHKDYTMMRGLVMDFPKDPKVTNIGDQYMFGPSLLVNPVYEYKARNRNVYLPAGQGWYDLYSGRYHTGGQSINAGAPYDRMPVYVKEGSIIPFGPELQYTDEKPADTISLYVYTGKDATFTLYEDEGTNYQYEKGRFTTIRFDYNEATKTLSIGDREGNFPGMLNKRIFNIIPVGKLQNTPLGFHTKGMLLSYDGKKQAARIVL